MSRSTMRGPPEFSEIHPEPMEVPFLFPTGAFLTLLEGAVYPRHRAAESALAKQRRTKE